MPTRLWSVVVDAGDPPALARFWSAALDWPIVFEDPDDEEVVVASPPGEMPPGTPGLVFVPVDDPKIVKNRVHLDLATTSDDDYAEVLARVRSLGATPVDIGQRADATWEVLADPEGNEFCVLRPREVYTDVGPLAAIVVDARDPAVLAQFWTEVVGWSTVGPDSDGDWGLRPPAGRGPSLEFIGVPDVKTVKNRLHLDVAPEPGDDHAAAVERLLSLGATRVDVGQGDVSWEVLADPEGNELCVLTPRGTLHAVYGPTADG